MDTLNRGDNLYIAAFANGQVKLIHPSGNLLLEISAHSRSLNALTCHPTKSIFATCSDDTLMNVFEVTGDKSDKIDVTLIVSSRVNDYQLTGVAFAGNSVIAAPYDFKNLAVWNSIV